jgi:hypothetical protein
VTLRARRVNVPVDITGDPARLLWIKREGSLRLLLIGGVSLALVSCGGGEEANKVPPGASELTVTLPPTLPTEPAETNQISVETETPQAGFETIAATPPPKPPASKSVVKATPEPVPDLPSVETPPEVEVAVAPAEEPVPSAGALPPGTRNWGAYIRKARFPCGQVASVQPVERAGASPGFPLLPRRMRRRRRLPGYR